MKLSTCLHVNMSRRLQLSCALAGARACDWSASSLASKLAVVARKVRGFKEFHEVVSR